MAHFAKIGTGNKVTQIVVVHNNELLDESGQESEQKGIDFLKQMYNNSNEVWKQTSYNNNIRKNYAAVGYKYSSDKDAFIAPRPFSSWVLNEDTCVWNPPISFPDDGKNYNWNESTKDWDVIA